MTLSFLAKTSLIMVAGLPEFDTTCAIQYQSYIVKVTKSTMLLVGFWSRNDETGLADRQSDK